MAPTEKSNDPQAIWGLIGSKGISKYSVAPRIWKKLFLTKRLNVKYKIIEASTKRALKIAIKNCLRNPSFKGLNIAFPWKKEMAKYCSKIESLANKTGTINTIVNNNGIVSGYNTDGIGLINASKKITSFNKKDVLLLGCGGAAQTIPFFLIKEKVNEIALFDINSESAQRLNKRFNSLSKKEGVKIIAIKKSEISKKLKGADILINMTPCGMKEHPLSCALDKNELKNLRKNTVTIEAVYNPFKTPLLKFAELKGGKICPGINMLVEQAALSYEIAFGEKLSLKEKKILMLEAKSGLK